MHALIIVPTYNEAENIKPLVEQIHALQAPADSTIEILVIDDNSTDGTGNIVKKLMTDHSRVHLLERPGKLGLGTAYLAGFAYALKGNYDYAFTMDADFSHNPSYIPKMLEMAMNNNADLVIGSRYVPGGGVRNWGIHRKALSRIANALAHTTLGIKARDCTSGFRCYRKDLLDFLENQDVHSHGYSCLIELLFRSQKAGAKIKEFPIIFIDREMGQSKVSKREIRKALETLWRLFPLRFRTFPSKFNQ